VTSADAPREGAPLPPPPPGPHALLLLLDTRYSRDAYPASPFAPAAGAGAPAPQDMLGEAQWGWLEAQLAARGELAIGLSFDTTCHAQKAQGRPVEIVYGRITPNVMEGGGLVAGARNRAEAQLFLDFMASEAAARVLTTLVGATAVPGFGLVDLNSITLWQMRRYLQSETARLGALLDEWLRAFLLRERVECQQNGGAPLGQLRWRARELVRQAGRRLVEQLPLHEQLKENGVRVDGVRRAAFSELALQAGTQLGTQRLEVARALELRALGLKGRWRRLGGLTRGCSGRRRRDPARQTDREGRLRLWEDHERHQALTDTGGEVAQQPTPQEREWVLCGLLEPTRRCT
jgi:hypothetical protein